MNPVEVIERQLSHYNAHDLEAFCSMYSEDIEIRNMTVSEPLLVGKEALRARYRESFQNPRLHASIVARMCVGNFVIDHEIVSGKTENAIEVGVVYQVEADLIRRVSFTR